MKKHSSLIFSIVYGVIFILSLTTNWYAELVLTLEGVIVFSVLYKLGNGIILREIIALHGVSVCLVAPLAGYNFYTVENPLARLFIKYMPIQYQVYFSFALPAMAGFVFAVCLPLLNQKKAVMRASLLLPGSGKLRAYWLTRAM